MSLAYKFMLSGISQGLYVFAQNPAEYQISPPISEFNVVKTIEGNDVFQQAFTDNVTRQMNWRIADRSLYTSLKNFTIRDSYGNIPVSYFFDGSVKEMQGVPVKVIDVFGEPIAGNYDKWTISLTLKPEIENSKIYKLIQT